MTNESKVIEKLRHILVDLNFSSAAKTVKTDEDLFEAGALDSLTLIQFVLALEESFGIELNNDDINYENFKNLEQMSQVLRQKYKI